MPSNKHYPTRLWSICLSLTLLFLAACANTSPTLSPPLSGAKAPTQAPTRITTPAANLGAPGCKPASPIGQSAIQGLPEVQGSAPGAELWALFFAPVPIQAKQDEKIVWRMTGTGDFHLVVQGPHGIRIQPIFGPVYHPSSNWARPGEEWGTGYNFPIAGCWDLHATRDTTSGDVWLLVR